MIWIDYLLKEHYLYRYIKLNKRKKNEINKIFIEIVVAPSYSEEALEVLKSKKNISFSSFIVTVTQVLLVALLM